MKPITYIVENKNGVYHYDSFEINRIIGLIRVHRLQPKEHTTNNIIGVLEKILIKGEEQKIHPYFSAYGISVPIFDLYVDNSSENSELLGKFISHTNDLDFKLIDNSKIEVTLFSKNKVNLVRQHKEEMWWHSIKDYSAIKKIRVMGVRKKT